MGHVRSGKRTFGYEVTLFKFDHVQPKGFAAPVTVFRTDVAITDEAAQRFPHRITYFFPGSATVSSTTLKVHIGNATLSGSSPQAMSLQASFARSGLDLMLSSRRPPMYVGGRGYIALGSGYTYYYSLTDLATSGSLKVGGKSYRVSGISWLDHQWGKWSWLSVGGWTWMAWQLDNGTQLSIFDVRSSEGRVRAVSLLRSDGKTSTIHGVTVRSTGVWRSPHTGGVYPFGWTVRIPSLRAAVRVEPTVRDQEMALPAQPAASYWEGSSRLRGTFMGKSVTGLGYTELTGYAGH